MRALIAAAGGPRVVHDYPEPPLVPGGALVRVRRAGVDFTDVEVAHGYRDYRGPLGNAFVGEVVETTAEHAELRGARVVGGINYGCGGPSCAELGEEYCPHRFVLGIAPLRCSHASFAAPAGGAFADCVSLPVRKLHRVPENVSDRAALFCEPVAAAVQILEQVHVKPTDRVVLLGDGALAFGVAQVVRWIGCDLTVAGTFPERLRHFERLGIATCRYDEWDAQVDLAIESSGEPWGPAWALRHVRPNGTVVLKSTIREASEIDLSRAVVDQITLIGSRSGPFQPVLDALAAGRLVVEEFVEASFSLEDGVAALAAAAAPGARKIEIVMNEEA